MKYPTHPDTVSVEDTGAPRHIGLFLFDGVEELDAVGPWEVLAYWTRHHSEDGWSITCLSVGGATSSGRRTSSWVPTTPSTTPHPSTF